MNMIDPYELQYCINIMRGHLKMFDKFTPSDLTEDVVYGHVKFITTKPEMFIAYLLAADDYSLGSGIYETFKQLHQWYRDTRTSFADSEYRHYWRRCCSPGDSMFEEMKKESAHRNGLRNIGSW